MFLKTHKTGSSTLTSILNRYADLNDLRMALPSPGRYRFGWPVKFHWRYLDVVRAHGKRLHMLANHARYDRKKMNVVMRPGTRYITILRDPVTLFESTFHYMEFDKILNLTWSKNPIQTFLDDPLKIMRSKRVHHESLNLIRNGMFYDLGMDPSVYDSLYDINSSIENINNEFDLVLMMEYFDESLVLMMREFCWGFDDILYFKQNERAKKRDPLPEWTKFQIRAWNMADTQLYNFFNRTFWEKIRSHGESFYDDLEEFRLIIDHLKEQCLSDTIKEEVAFRLQSRVKAFVLDPKAPVFQKYFCVKMLRNEIDYIKYFRLKMNPYGPYFKQMEEEGRIKNETIDLYLRIQADQAEEVRQTNVRVQQMRARQLAQASWNRYSNLSRAPPPKSNPVDDRVRFITQQVRGLQTQRRNFKTSDEILVGDLVATPESERNTFNTAARTLDNHPRAHDNMNSNTKNLQRTPVSRGIEHTVAGNTQVQEEKPDTRTTFKLPTRPIAAPHSDQTYEDNRDGR